ncbi:MAG: FAD:protein FMN transferase [Vicinamibacteria bacterium]
MRHPKVPIVLVLLAAACGPRPEGKLEGRTMGTTYHVTIVGLDEARARAVQPRLDARLEQVNDSMSTYRPQSELNRFNRLARAGETFPASTDLMAVLRACARVHELSGGAWDGTVMPLVDLWGFGPSGPVDEPPPDAAVRERLAHVGFDRIEVRRDGLAKKDPAVTLDLSSIAKGYGVDQVAAVLRAEGLRDFVVEIGGEVYASGSRRDGRPWRVGVNRPRADAAPDDVLEVRPCGTRPSPRAATTWLTSEPRCPLLARPRPAHRPAGDERSRERVRPRARLHPRRRPRHGGHGDGGRGRDPAARAARGRRGDGDRRGAGRPPRRASHERLPHRAA